MEVAALGLRVESREPEKAADALDRLTKSAQGAEKSSDRFGKSATDAGRKAKTANESASVSADRMAASYGRVNAALATAAKRMLGFAAATMGLAAMSRTLSGFEKSMAAVSAITRASEKDLTALRNVAKELGATTEFSASQAADGLKFLGMAGFSAAQSIAALPKVLDLATAAQMDLAQAADISSNIMSAFGIKATEMTEVTDILAAASSRANTDVNQLGEAMKMVGPVASAMGVSINDTAAAIGTLSDAGIQSTMAGTGLRRILSSLANPTKQSADAIRSLGISISDLDPMTTPVVDIVGKLRDAGLEAADAFQIFGDRGAPAILALVENEPKLRDLTNTLSDVGGEAERMAKTMRDQLEGDFKGLMSAAEGVIIAMGEAGLIAAIRAVVQGMTWLVRKLSEAIDFTSRLAATIGSMLAPAFDVIAPIMQDLSKWVDVALVALAGFYSPAVIGGIALLTASLAIGLVNAIKAVTLAMLANPIGLFVAAIVGAGYAVYKFQDQLDDLFRGAIKGMDSLRGHIGGTMDAIGAIWNTAWENMAIAMRRVIDDIKRSFYSMIQSVVDALNVIPGVDLSAPMLVNLNEDKEKFINVGEAAAKAYKEGFARESKKGSVMPAYEAYRESRLQKQAVDAINASLAEQAYTTGQVSEATSELSKLLKELDAGQNNLSKSTEKATKELDAFAKQREADYIAKKADISALHEQAQALEDQVKTFGQGKRAIEQLTISRMRDLLQVQMGIDATSQAVELLKLEIAARERLLEQGQRMDELEAAKSLHDAMTADWKSTVDEYGRVFRDGFAGMINNGKRGWKSFTKSLVTTFKTTVADQIYKMLAQPFVVKIVASLAGITGMGGLAQAGSTISNVGNAASTTSSLGGMSLLTNFGGSVAGSVTDLGGWMASSGSKVISDAGANLIMSADKIGSFAGIAGDVFGYGGAILSAAKGNWGSAAGAAAGTFLGGPIGSLIGSALGGFLDKSFSGETRHGGIYDWVRGDDSTARSKGWSRGDPGAEANSAISSIVEGARQSIDAAFAGVGSAASLGYFMGWAESSGKGRGGTASGGILDTASGQVQFGTERKGQGHGGRSGDLGQMIDWLAVDLQQTVIQAWQAGIDEFPALIQDMIRGIDADSLTGEQAQAVVANVLTTIEQVNALAEAFNNLPFENLKELTFDATAALMEFGGGAQAFTTNLGTYFKEFYSEEEQLEFAAKQMSDAFASMGREMPDVTQGADAAKAAFRAMVDSIDVTTTAGQQAYATMIALSGGFAQLAVGMENLGGAVDSTVDTIANAFSQIERLASQLDRTLQAKLSAGALADRIGGMIGISPVFGPRRETELWGDIATNAALGDDRDWVRQYEMASELTDLTLNRIALEQQAQQRQAQAIREQISGLTRMRDMAVSLQNYLKSLESSSLAPYSLQEKVSIAESELARLVRAARGGDQAAMGQVQGALQNTLQLWREYGASGEDYQAAYHRLTGSVKGLADSAANSASSQIAALERQASALEANNGYTQRQLEELTSLHMLATEAAEALDAQYQEEMAATQDQMEMISRMSLNTDRLHEIADLMAGLPASIAVHLAPLMPVGTMVNGSFAGGLSRVPFDGFIAELHKDERVLTASEARHYDVSRGGGASGSNALIGEIRMLRAEVAQLRRQNESLGRAQVDATVSSARDTAQRIVGGVSESLTRRGRDDVNAAKSVRRGILA